MAKLTIRKKSSNKKKLTPQKLRLYNLIIGALYLIQAGAILLLSNSLRGAVPINTGFLSKDKLASESLGHSVTVPASHHLFDLNLAYLVAAVLLVGGLVRLLHATAWRERYEQAIKAGSSYIYYGESAAALALVVGSLALVSGVFDLSTLIILMILGGLLSLGGLLMKLGRLGFWLALKAVVLPWLVILIYLFGSHAFGDGIAAYIYALYLSMLVLFAALFANSYASYKRFKQWKDYIYAERSYILLTFATITAFTWQLFFGTLR